MMKRVDRVSDVLITSISTFAAVSGVFMFLLVFAAFAVFFFNVGYSGPILLILLLPSIFISAIFWAAAILLKRRPIIGAILFTIIGLSSLCTSIVIIIRSIRVIDGPEYEYLLCSVPFLICGGLAIVYWWRERNTDNTRAVEKEIESSDSYLERHPIIMSFLVGFFISSLILIVTEGFFSYSRGMEPDFLSIMYPFPLLVGSLATVGGFIGKRVGKNLGKYTGIDKPQFIGSLVGVILATIIGLITGMLCNLFTIRL